MRIELGVGVRQGHPWPLVLALFSSQPALNRLEVLTVAVVLECVCVYVCVEREAPGDTTLHLPDLHWKSGIDQECGADQTWLIPQGPGAGRMGILLRHSAAELAGGS